MSILFEQLWCELHRLPFRGKWTYLLRAID